MGERWSQTQTEGQRRTIEKVPMSETYRLVLAEVTNHGIEAKTVASRFNQRSAWANQILKGLMRRGLVYKKSGKWYRGDHDEL